MTLDPNMFDYMQELESKLKKSMLPPPGGNAELWRILNRESDKGAKAASLVLFWGGHWFADSLVASEKSAGHQGFQNALVYTEANLGWTYVEGYAVRAAQQLPVHHAWVVNSGGLILDPTWPDGVEYLGVGIDSAVLQRLAPNAAIDGVFSDVHAPKWFFDECDKYVVPVVSLRESRQGTL